MSHQKYRWATWTVLCAALASESLSGQERLGYTSIGEPPGYFAAQTPDPATAVPGTGILPPQSPPPTTIAAPAKPPEDDLVVVSAKELKLSEPWKIGDFKLVPYGALWSDMIYATERNYPGAFTLFIPSPETQGESAFTIDARRTRLGFNLTGPDVDCFGGAKTGGQVEIDFFGQFVTAENQAGVQLRHAYWEAKNDQWRMLVGQNWDVISPLMPNTINYSVGWMGGNIGFRKPQFRWERYLDFSPTSLGILQLSLNHDINPDFITATNVNRESASWPVIESRVAWKFGERGEKGLPLEVGVSGHIGRTEFDFLGLGPPPALLPPEDDRTFRTWSFNIDLKAPINECNGIQGEFYTGANLSAFFGGIGQGVCSCMRVPIRDTGGWIEYWHDWNPRLHSHVGFSVDDPNNRDSLVGRTYNSFVFTNLMYDITKKFSTGFEVSYWQTSYMDRRVGQIPPAQLGPTEQANSVVFDWMVKYGF
jgi:hypothetical protein